MNIEEKNLKLHVNKKNAGLDSAQYYLTYKQKNSEKNIRSTSYEILSLLKTDNDIIIEVNSSFLNLAGKEKNDYFHRFMETLRSLGLEFRYRKVPVKTNRSLFSLFLGKKEEKGHEVISYIPDHVWQRDTFRKILPIQPARYYILKKDAPEPDKFLAEMDRMMDCDKLDLFNLIVFAAGELSRIGINSRKLTYEEIKKLLNL